MSLTKTDTVLGNYIETGSKKVNSKSAMRKAYRKAVDEQSSMYTLSLLAYKHKVGLLMLGNIILVLNWAFPMWTEFVKSIF